MITELAPKRLITSPLARPYRGPQQEGQDEGQRQQGLTLLHRHGDVGLGQSAWV